MSLVFKKKTIKILNILIFLVLIPLPRLSIITFYFAVRSVFATRCRHFIPLSLSATAFNPPPPHLIALTYLLACLSAYLNTRFLETIWTPLRFFLFFIHSLVRQHRHPYCTVHISICIPVFYWFLFFQFYTYLTVYYFCQSIEIKIYFTFLLQPNLIRPHDLIAALESLLHRYNKSAPFSTCLAHVVCRWKRANVLEDPISSSSVHAPPFWLRKDTSHCKCHSP